MKTPLCLSFVLLSVTLIGCTDTARQTATATAPAPKPSASATAMDHSAMGHSMSHAMGTVGMKSLQAKTGDEFDKAFLSQMIAHHEAAVQMAQQVLPTAKPETKRDAQSVIDSQQKEIAQMTGWLTDWYNTAPDRQEQALVNADMKDMMAMPVTTDTMFYEMMSPHHQGAIDMSELALKNAKHDAVKAIARKIIAAQKAEIVEYKKKRGQAM